MMKKQLIPAVLFIFLVSSCSIIGPDPQVRFTDPDQWFVEIGIGTVSGTIFTTEVSYVFMNDFTLSAYMSLQPGTWDIAYKNQYAGSTQWSGWFHVLTKNFVKGKKYTLAFASTGLVDGGAVTVTED